MSKNSLILVLQNKQENSTIDIAKIVQTESRAQVYLNALQRCSLSYAKIQIKSEKLTPFGGIFLSLSILLLLYSLGSTASEMSDEARDGSSNE